jgi:hypothetical protein
MTDTCIQKKQEQEDAIALLEYLAADEILNQRVHALPTTVTQRYNEICWAQGGVGYGWWPSCIYDPRLTLNGPRHEAMKSLGQKQLVYFFMCDESPFSVLAESKIMTWEDGMVADLHLGRAAKNHSKIRYMAFRAALHMAIIEIGKRPERRLEWNNVEQPVSTIFLDLPMTENTTMMDVSTNPSTSNNNDDDERDDVTKKTRAIDSVQIKSRVACSLFPYDPEAATSTRSCLPIGFVLVSNVESTTFADVRLEVKKQGLRMPPTWRFYIPNLGPVTAVQEKSCGPMHKFLLESISSTCGEGSLRNPIKLHFVEK